ncbi:MAG: TerB N-terminal domain-containing protein [Lachnospiraceae bacterium]|jgi:hypothetical protein|nr:TerB N-terminal domain-containing protein [Lachnospiraceae bacterium]
MYSNQNQKLPPDNTRTPTALVFHEIEYDSSPAATMETAASSISSHGKPDSGGDGNHVAASSQPLPSPAHDEIRELFSQMRDIARAQRSTYSYTRFFDRRIQQDNAIIFYQQALFMKDFTDDYSGNKPFSQYFPFYQMMGYEQLRTYFTWRTKVKNGDITATSLSYAFLYIYELLNNIGIDDPGDALGKLMSFWQGFRPLTPSIDKYMLCWLKDYHIYYELPHTWSVFVRTHGLELYFPNILTDDDDFGLFSSISKYDIRKSAFFTPATSEMIIDCFSFVLNRIKREFEAAGISFDTVFFSPTKRLIPWTPFKDALFHARSTQADRSVIFGAGELYVCKNNEWKQSVNLTTEKGRQFVGFVMKQMESSLREVTKYKYKLTAKVEMVNENTLRVLGKSGLFIDQIVPAAVAEFHRLKTATVVKVNQNSLARIREEALITQQALIVPEDIAAHEHPPPVNPAASLPATVSEENITTDSLAATVSDPANSDFCGDEWTGLGNALDETEIKALALLVDNGNLKSFSAENGVMLEVLLDSINEKALVYIGDNLVANDIADEDFMLYDEYLEQIKSMVNEHDK